MSAASLFVNLNVTSNETCSTSLVATSILCRLRLIQFPATCCQRFLYPCDRFWAKCLLTQGSSLQGVDERLRILSEMRLE